MEQWAETSALTAKSERPRIWLRLMRRRPGWICSAIKISTTAVSRISYPARRLRLGGKRSRASNSDSGNNSGSGSSGTGTSSDSSKANDRLNGALKDSGDTTSNNASLSSKVLSAAGAKTDETTTVSTGSVGTTGNGAAGSSTAKKDAAATGSYHKTGKSGFRGSSGRRVHRIPRCNC